MTVQPSGAALAAGEPGHVIRLFTTLIRFDPVYVGHFKCNIRWIADYPRLSDYMRTLFRIEDVAATVDFGHIKRHYYQNHRNLNPSGIVPVGPELAFMSRASAERLSARL